MSQTSRRTRKSLAAPDRRLRLIVFQAGKAVITETREITLKAGKNAVQLDGLPTSYVEDSLVVLSAQGPGDINLGTASFEPANMNAQTIPQKAVDQRVTLYTLTPQGELPVAGTLRHVLNGQVVLEKDGGELLVMPMPNKYALNDGMPKGLATTPSFIWRPTVTEGGKYVVRFLYETRNLRWVSRYNAFYDRKRRVLKRFECVIDIKNKSGLAITEGTFNLFTGSNGSDAGGGHLQPHAAPAMAGRSVKSSVQQESFMVADNAVVETVGGQKKYKLPEALTVSENGTEHGTLIHASDVPVVEELYLPVGYYSYVQPGSEDDDTAEKEPVFTRLKAKNDEASNLGFDMPSGPLEFFVYDSEGEECKVDKAQVATRSNGEPFDLDLEKPNADVKALRRLTFSHTDPEPPETEEAEEVADGGEASMPEVSMTAMPITSPGGPGVGTPEEGSRRRRRVAEGAGKKKEKKKVYVARFHEEEREIVLFNYSDEDAVVKVSEQVPQNAEWLKKGFEFNETTLGGGTVHLTVPAKTAEGCGKVTVSYRLKWCVNPR